ncbi:MAG: PP2C family protein-serine/threonine phosphatase [Solirubrobacteraceae bacterium]
MNYALHLGRSRSQSHLLLTNLPRIPSGGTGIDVGGDWYDLLAVGDGAALLVIGDVAGHGLQAARTMAALRHATLAYAVHDPRPASVLDWLADFVQSGGQPYFATALCALLDVRRRSICVASAGHPPPLVIADGRASFIELEPGVPIGAPRTGDRYRETSLALDDGATMR